MSYTVVGKGERRIMKRDALNLVETKGGIMLTPFDPKFSDWTAAYLRADKKYRKILRDLAT